jgi:hypothetical protein
VKRPAPLRVLYNGGWKFFAPVVLRNGRSSEWLVLGAGRPVLGDGYPTWREAIDHAVRGVR